MQTMQPHGEGACRHQVAEVLKSFGGEVRPYVFVGEGMVK